MRKLLVNLSRLLLALTFILSGFVKAVDPLGTQYKIHDYLEAMHLVQFVPDFLILGVSVVLSALEFLLGICFFFAIHRRLASRIMLLVMVVMTALTLWLALTNPISDCGCFGDAFTLTNWQTFWKNVILLLAAIVTWRWHADMVRFIGLSNQWIVFNYSMLFILILSAWSLYDLPFFDFRPYHVGANIPQSMEIPADAPQPQFETTFVLEKDGHRQEFTIDDYPDSTWTFVDSRTVQTAEGYVPPIHDFTITTADGDDITDDVLAFPGYTLLLVSPHLENADDSQLDRINWWYEYSREHGYPFYCLTASGQKAISLWTEMTGAEYPFCSTDETTLKTIIRSNPGMLLLHNGTIIRKWSHNRLPVIAEEHSSLPLDGLAEGQMPTDSVPGKIIQILLWFVLPLALLTMADRLWAWSQWLRRPGKKRENSPKT